MSSSGRMFLLIVAILAMTSPAARAQPTGRYSRVTTVRQGTVARPVNVSRTPRPALTETSSHVAPEFDPLRPYSAVGRDGSPAARTGSSWSEQSHPTPPSMPVQAPAVARSFYPSMRSGQSFNRNVPSHGGRSHCLPGRASMLGR